MRRGIRTIGIIFLATSLMLLISGCGRGLGLSPNQTTATLTATPAAITAGQNVTLTWSTVNATSVQLDNGIGTLSAGSGSMTVMPQQTTTYTLTAAGPLGNVTAQATVTVTGNAPTVTITAAPTSVPNGQSSVLTVTATNATTVAVTNNVDSTSSALPAAGGTLTVTPVKTTTYTATATGNFGTATATATVTVTQPGNVTAIQHVVFMLQENRTFDHYFGLLNPYRRANSLNVGDDGKVYDVDGTDDKLSTISNQDDEGNSYNLFKLASTCVDDMSSAWIESYGMVDRFNFKTTRPVLMDGFVHIGENFAKSGSGSGTFTDTQGRRAMGYYDQDFLNYYYFMASQFALSDRWFSPVASKSIPNRVATFSGGTTQGLVRDQINNDHFGQLPMLTIFEQLDNANVSWKIYYSVTNGGCSTASDECSGSSGSAFPATTFSYFTYSKKYLRGNSGSCPAPTVGSQAVGDATNSFCIDPNHIAPLSQYFTDLQNNTLPAFAFIEAEYGHTDEHPGSGQSVLSGQSKVASIVNAFMTSPAWGSSVFFLSYDEGGGPYDHVPPVPNQTNKNTAAAMGITTDISSIAVNPDSFNPCLADGSVHCDLKAGEPGADPADAAAVQGFAAQLGFRVPNMVISPFTRKHFVSHVPMDHTAILKFVESRFINSSAHITARDAAQPDLLDFFDFTAIPWAVPPTPPAPVTPQSLGHDPCKPDAMGP
jgi:phospholipase C